MKDEPERYEDAARALARAAAELHRRGFMLATSGNLSVVVEKEPLRLMVTPSGGDKGALESADMVQVDEKGAVVAGANRPSAETALHLEIVSQTDAQSVVHTHSVWSTLVSSGHAVEGGVTVSGFEMLKALRGVTTHRHREWVPILANAQDYAELRQEVKRTLQARPESHGLLLAGHGLYSWGTSLREALRHAEALEFLLEVKGRGEGRAEGR